MVFKACVVVCLAFTLNGCSKATIPDDWVERVRVQPPTATLTQEVISGTFNPGPLGLVAFAFITNSTMTAWDTRNVTTDAVWSSSDPSVASIDSPGRVTLRKRGTALITAEYRTTRGDYTVFVR
jgi:hypothetical protein